MSEAGQTKDGFVGRPLVRYVLFQIPGWILAAALLYWLWPRTGLEPWLGALAVAVWIAKDFVMWPLMKAAYQTDVRTGGEEFVGETAVVQKRLAPIGSVRIRGELWRAREEGEGGAVDAGATVEVIAARGMTLVVRRLPPDC